jgi:hypothetical protein
VTIQHKESAPAGITWSEIGDILPEGTFGAAESSFNAGDVIVAINGTYVFNVQSSANAIVTCLKDTWVVDLQVVGEENARAVVTPVPTWDGSDGSNMTQDTSDTATVSRLLPHSRVLHLI